MASRLSSRQSVLEPRIDAATEGAFLRQLEDLEAEVQHIEYSELPFANGTLLPIETENKPWARTVTYRQLDRVGHFKQIRSYATDIPTISILSQEFTQPVYRFAGATYYTDDDIIAVQHRGEDLPDEQITALTESSEQTLNELIAFGRTPEGIDSGFDGFIQHPAALHSMSPYPINSTSTGNEILALMHDSVTSVVKLTKMIEKPDTLLLPVDQYHYAMNTRIENSVSDTTILQQFIKTTPYIKDVFPVNELAGSGIDGSDTMIVYRRDKTRIKVRVKQALTWNNWERKGLGYERIASFKYGGIALYRPYSVHIVSGI